MAAANNEILVVVFGLGFVGGGGMNGIGNVAAVCGQLIFFCDVVKLANSWAYFFEFKLCCS
jgi:hypothetical protein